MPSYGRRRGFSVVNIGNFTQRWSNIDVISHCYFFFSSRRRHTRFDCDWSSDVCSSDLVRRWCGQRGLTLRITNEGHHWQIADGGFLAEWWPSSAKLVIGKKWHDGIHCHEIGRASCRERV